MKGYFGSVRFFKNLILLLVILFIALPTGFSIGYRVELSKLETQLENETANSEALQESVHSLQQTVTSLQEQLDSRGIDPDGAAYQELYPDFYAPQPLSAKTRESGVIYLTFDDGPSARTPEVLEILREENVKATFFVIGNTSSQAKQWMRDIVSEGHTIAMHSYSHNYDTIYSSVEAYLKDMYKIFKLIKETTGVTPTVFRFPGGSINGYNYEVYQDIVSEMMRRGFVPYDWNVSSGDAASSSPTPTNTIVRNVLNGAKNLNRGVVLMHDASAKTTTVAALRPIIQGLREQGFRFDCLKPETAPILWAYDH